MKKEKIDKTQSWLGPGGKNIFLEIKKKRIAAEAKGIKPILLSIGQPKGPALLSARKAAAQAIMSSKECMHEYQDNGSPGCPNFAEKFIQFHLQQPLSQYDNIGYLPTPGSKSMLEFVIKACKPNPKNPLFVATMTKPGYPTPGYWADYLAEKGVVHTVLETNPENGFLPVLHEIASVFPEKHRGLLMLNLPENPTGQIAYKGWLMSVCKFCEKHEIRIFNDAAYSALDHSGKHTALADITSYFKRLSWCEAFSASKLIGNGTGWRIGAMVGSIDFIEDIKTMKGNGDSGFNAALAKGVLAAIDKDLKRIIKQKNLYGNRIKILVKALVGAGMKLAVEPRAGFFTLWIAPKKAFGVKIKDAEHFNNLMIENTGIIGVPFGPYIRYAVCVEPIATKKKIIAEAFAKAKVSY